MGTSRTDCYDKYYQYMQTVIPKLLEAENTIKEIKSSYEWKRAFNYFHVLANRGQIKEQPSSKNGYKIERVDNLVKITDIADILTPEQLEQIKSKAFSI